jgi:hypothetical protein
MMAEEDREDSGPEERWFSVNANCFVKCICIEPNLETSLGMPKQCYMTQHNISNVNS